MTDQIGNITLAGNLAENLVACLKAGVTGTLALAGRDLLSRFDIARRVAAFYGLDASRITPILTADLKQPAPRPLNSGFTLERAAAMPGVRLLTFEEQLKEYDHG